MPEDGGDTLPTTVADTNHPWSRIGSDTSSSHAGQRSSLKQRCRVWQERVGHTIESRPTHLLVLFLLTVDVACVIADLGYGFLTRDCDNAHNHDPAWLGALAHVALVITAVFMVEIVLALFAFGPEFYNPFGKIPLATLHLFDAIVIITTFVLEVVLKGKVEEFAALLIILRFWRIIKLMEGVALGAGELGAEAAEELALTRETLLRVQGELLASQNEVQRLRQRLLTAGITPDDPDDEVQVRQISGSSP
ncbi:hypothetical protein D9756_001657 [Leucocoprinus leucothites]|uniref:Hydrogen voltage-gated channel 1 n=1 Tax=Leucocoprinus leucothites TaxID=201217 RepID=A0A8H5G422_9AGAR|nr:hypothetical protein D9756_001657 [Leucoagaricus leucothites]